MSSTSLYNSFGSNPGQLDADTLRAYLDTATIKFALPEGTADSLSVLADPALKSLDPQTYEQLEQRLRRSGYNTASAAIMANILMQVAKSQGVSPFTYFEVNSDTLKFTADTYQIINSIRAMGNRIGLVNPVRPVPAQVRRLIRP